MHLSTTGFWTLTALFAPIQLTKASVLSAAAAGRCSPSGMSSGLESLSHQTGKKTFSIQTWLCAQGHHHHVETGKGLPQTASTALLDHYCLDFHCMLQ